MVIIFYQRLFGDSKRQDYDNRASQVHFSDQRLLLFPVRSLAGTFAWITSLYDIIKQAVFLCQGYFFLEPNWLPKHYDWKIRTTVTHTGIL